MALHPIAIHCFVSEHPRSYKLQAGPQIPGCAPGTSVQLHLGIHTKVWGLDVKTKHQFQVGLGWGEVAGWKVLNQNGISCWMEDQL